MNSNSRLLAASRTVLIFSVATQLLAIAYYWWVLDPRLSCDRLSYWGEWLDCLHGPSHIHTFMSEAAICVWLIAGLAALLGRYLPAYVSVSLPLLIAIGTVWSMIERVRGYIYLYGELTVSDLLLSIGSTTILLIFVVGPLVGGWLTGLRRRKVHRDLRSSVQAA